MTTKTKGFSLGLILFDPLIVSGIGLGNEFYLVFLFFVDRIKILCESQCSPLIKMN